MEQRSANWIKSPLADSLWILSPPFACLGVVILFPQWFQNTSETGLLSWFILVVLIDVSHVYSTLYRCYFDPYFQVNYGKLMQVLPLGALLGSYLLYSQSAELFWTVLAYLAVFHFVRQQYGFLRIYNRFETNGWIKKFETLLIYAACIYPLFYWHIAGDRNFHWFKEEDFLLFPHLDYLLPWLKAFYFSLWGIYLLILVYSAIVFKIVNVQKILVLSGTALSWYMGIVYFNSDFGFTLFNVVAHGIPYFGLVWMDGNAKKEKGYFPKTHIGNTIFNIKWIGLFIGLPILLAYCEEFAWDLLIWKERGDLFPFSLAVNFDWHLLVPLLALPQLVHYLLDGFIWKQKKNSIPIN